MSARADNSPAIPDDWTPQTRVRRRWAGSQNRLVEVEVSPGLWRLAGSIRKTFDGKWEAAVGYFEPGADVLGPFSTQREAKEALVPPAVKAHETRAAA